eukprot:Protomagalhaensia_wolfi_Nauph_80__936@NODE_153_length_3394_cov_45_195231_g114_i0_p2_GENE_NODE_153_length_3394_cov_45_195231_g114_i0NODE_153_length_3394_cov_45_195231_g114_i0_p2_ORF_typecomplete_len266_score40_89_NODE_153_length_3394_cov_45_195231_g114_i07361533
MKAPVTTSPSSLSSLGTLVLTGWVKCWTLFHADNPKGLVVTVTEDEELQRVMDKFIPRTNGNYHYLAQTNGALIWSDKKKMYAVFKLEAEEAILKLFNGAHISFCQKLKTAFSKDKRDVKDAVKEAMESHIGYYMSSANRFTLGTQLDLKEKTLRASGLHKDHPALTQIMAGRCCLGCCCCCCCCCCSRPKGEPYDKLEGWRGKLYKQENGYMTYSAKKKTEKGVVSIAVYDFENEDALYVRRLSVFKNQVKYFLPQELVKNLEL